MLEQETVTVAVLEEPVVLSCALIVNCPFGTTIAVAEILLINNQLCPAWGVTLISTLDFSAASSPKINADVQNVKF